MLTRCFERYGPCHTLGTACVPEMRRRVWQGPVLENGEGTEAGTLGEPEGGLLRGCLTLPTAAGGHDPQQDCAWGSLLLPLCLPPPGRGEQGVRTPGRGWEGSAAAGKALGVKFSVVTACFLRDAVSRRPGMEGLQWV